MKYILDGYNIIHKIDYLQNRRLRSQREGLIRLLEIAQAQNARLKDLTVVFDGKANILAPPMHSAVKVIFSKEKCADEEIKEIVQFSNYARDIGVVSDDRQIKSYARTLGAKKVSVKEFLKMVFASFGEKHIFKLDEEEAAKINQELEKIWLDK